MDNPETIVYAKDRPTSSCACGCESDNDFYNFPVDPNARIVEIAPSHPQILITDQSSSQKWKFNIGFLPHEALDGTIVLVPKASDVTKPNPVLKGETIDEIDINWDWNNQVISQDLNNDGGVTNPALDTADRTVNITGLSITENTEFTLDGDDGLSLTGSTKQQSITMAFGNYFYYGHGASKLGAATSGLQAFLGGLNKEIVVAKENEVLATGVANEHFFFAYPKAYGLPSEIRKGLLSGGYIRLKNVSGTLVETIPDGQSESDIIISNGLASEAYYVFQSTFDYQLDPNISIEII